MHYLKIVEHVSKPLCIYRRGVHIIIYGRITMTTVAFEVALLFLLFFFFNTPLFTNILYVFMDNVYILFYVFTYVCNSPKSAKIVRAHLQKKKYSSTYPANEEMP